MDAYVIFAENLSVYEGQAVLFTVTAPRLEWLPCSSECAHRGPHEQRSADGCVVEPGIAKVWDESAQERFTCGHREAHRRANKALRRLGHEGRSVSKLLSWWELQKRGVLHAHVVLPVATSIERAWSREYVRAWEELSYERENRRGEPDDESEKSDDAAGAPAHFPQVTVLSP
jgi:hypothetical protein